MNVLNLALFFFFWHLWNPSADDHLFDHQTSWRQCEICPEIKFIGNHERQ